MQTKLWSDFSRGLNTDNAVPGDGWAEEMHDVVFLRGGEVTQRGSRTLIGQLHSGVMWTPTISGWGKHHSSPGTGRILSTIDDTGAHAGGGLSLSALGATGVSTTRWFSALVDGDGTDILLDGMTGSANIATQAGSEIIIGGNGRCLFRWAGSIKNTYRTGTISTATATKTIAGSGTTWSGNVEAGMYLYVQDASSPTNALNRRMFRILSVDSNTSLTVDIEPGQAITGAKYSISPVAFVSAPAGIFRSSYLSSGHDHPLPFAACVHQDKLFVAGAPESGGRNATSVLRWSSNPTENVDQYLGYEYWQPDAFADVSPGVGSQITGLASFGGKLVILKDTAVIALIGSVSSDGAPENAYFDVVSPTVGMPGDQRGCCMTPRGFVFASQTGLYLYDGSALTNLLSGRAQRYWDANYAGKITTITSHYHLYALRDRLVVDWGGGAAGVNDSGAMLVWSWERDAFYTVSRTATQGPAVWENYANVTREIYPATYACQFADMAGERTVPASSGSDYNDASNPTLQITTPPIIANERIRPTKLKAMYYLNGAATSPTLTFALMPGVNGSHPAGVAPFWSEVTGGTMAEVTREQWGRVAGWDPGADTAPPAVRIRITRTTAVATDIRLFALELEYEEIGE